MAAMIMVVCPVCNNRMRASTDYIGRQGRCPACKSLVEIKPPSGDPTATLHPAAATPAEAKLRSTAHATEVPGWLSGLIGAGAAALFYLVVYYGLANTYLGKLFHSGGTVSFVNTLVTCWGLGILGLKYFAVKRQQSYADLELELIPLDIGLTITPANVDQFLGHLGRLPPAQRGSILGRRMQGALEHFKSRNSVPEVQQYLATQSQIDASGVDSGYTLLRAFIWVNPILGFIGTVLGIGVAVGGLAGSLAQGGDIMTGLGSITGGLATAFDTTLIGLVMATLLLFPTEMLRKTEYSMLDRIEAFANESLLRRMAEDSAELDTKQLPEVVRHALEAAFQEHQRWLAQWQAQVAELGQVVGGDFEQAVVRVQEQSAQAEAARLERLQQVSNLLAEVFKDMGGATSTWQQVERETASRAEALVQAAQRLETTLLDTMKLSNQLLEKQNQTFEQMAASDLGTTIVGLQREIGHLAEKLDGRAAAAELAPTVSYHPAPRPEVPMAPVEPAKAGGGLFGIFRARR